MNITMLGVGNGFSNGVYDNNALLISNGITAMIDCGTTAWHSLWELGRDRDQVEEIFLTHLHFDHSGGVENAALYGKYITNKKIKLIVPEPIASKLWNHVLKGSIANQGEGLTSLSDFFQVQIPKEGEEFMLAGEKARFFTTRHIEGKFSCGLLLADRLFYTSDMVCDLPLLARMTDEGARIFFHDCQFNNAAVHADFRTLLRYPEGLQKQMFLMHHGLKKDDKAPDAGKMRFLYQHQTMEI